MALSTAWLRWARWATVLPLAWLAALALTDHLGANPIEQLIRELGTWALIWLCASLCVTPLRKLAGLTGFVALGALAPLRRTFGLSAFTYAILHFCAYAGWDQGFEIESILKDVLKRPFIAVGMAALFGLSVLAATSPKSVVRRLGGVRWRQIHRLIYAVVLLVLLHFWWHKAGKNDFARPLAYSGVIALALLARLAWAGIEWRRRRALRKAS
jgi:sulfoxide reductase heme-binding subunit YedZ